MRDHRFRGGEAREARERLDMRVADLASLVDSHPGTIHNLEGGFSQPSDALYLRLCAALRVDREALRYPKSEAA